MKKIRKRFTFEGKRYSVYADTKEEAIALAALKKRDLEEGKLMRESSMTVSQWAEEVIELHKSDIKGDNLRKYKSRIRACILDYIGSIPLKMIRPSQLQRMMNCQSGKSKTQINDTFYFVKLLFSSAVDEGLISSDPSATLKKPKPSPPKARRALTEEECRAFEQVLKLDDRYLLFALMYYAGLRPSEAKRVESSDIQGDMLRVRGSKTKAATRTVPVPGALIDLIPQDRTGILVLSSRGKPMGDYRKAWAALVRDMAGCGAIDTDDLSPYCLRHTYCTHLQEAGVDIRTAQYLMGHADIKMTANIYTHTREGELLKAASLIDKNRPLLKKQSPISSPTLSPIFTQNSPNSHS